MSNEIYFMNAGKFDIRAMLTFGVSAKEGENAIGYFGTGFKYAVAIILRLGGTVKVETKGDTYEFTTSKEVIRGEEFDIVNCNGVGAGFTTRMGINWDSWMAFRELYCNCKDEGGETSRERFGEFDTVVTVDCTEIVEAYENRHHYFLETTREPILRSATIEMFDGGHSNMFYRGVAVVSMNKPGLFTYSRVAHTALTEDRMAKSRENEFNYRIAESIQACDDEALIRRVLTAPDEAFESDLPFQTHWAVSPQFLMVAERLLKTQKGLRDPVRRILNESKKIKEGGWPEFQLTSLQEKQLKKAKEFLQGIDVDIDLFPIKFVTGLGHLVMGRALEGVTYMSDVPFQLGTKQVASTLLEEWLHNKNDCCDFDRAMQNWLFDKVLSVGEQLIGEPL